MILLRVQYYTQMHNIILSYIISKYTINHIKSSNIISDWEWYRLEEKEKEKESQKEIQTDWENKGKEGEVELDLETKWRY